MNIDASMLKEIAEAQNKWPEVAILYDCKDCYILTNTKISRGSSHAWDCYEPHRNSCQCFELLQWILEQEERPQIGLLKGEQYFYCSIIYDIEEDSKSLKESIVLAAYEFIKNVGHNG